MARGSVKSRTLVSRGSNGRRVVVYDAYVEAPRGPDGKRQRLKRAFPTRKEAQAWISKQNHAKESGAWTAMPGGFGDLMDSWLEAKEGELKPSTWHTYDRHVTKYLSALADKKVAALSSADFTRLYNRLTSTGLSATTVRSIHATARACMAWACAQEPPLADKNVVLRAHRPKRAAKEMTCWSGEEVAKLIAAAPEEYQPVYQLIASTGMRRGEVAGLRWEDVDLDAGRLQVRQTLVPSGGRLQVSTPKTEGSIRQIPLSATASESLKERRQQQVLERLASGARPGKFGDLVFTKDDGVSPLNLARLSKSVTKSAKRAGIANGRLHDLRHSFATIALSRGVPVLVVSKVLGHSQASTTLNVYGHLLPDAAIEAVQAVEGSMAGGFDA